MQRVLHVIMYSCVHISDVAAGEGGADFKPLCSDSCPSGIKHQILFEQPGSNMEILSTTVTEEVYLPAPCTCLRL